MEKPWLLLAGVIQIVAALAQTTQSIIDLVILCYNSNTCALAGEFANAMTIEECCSNNPDGLAFRKFDETCEPCIVYGFFNDSITQPEQRQGYMVRVGYMKGAAVGGNLIFDVMDTPGTAREGPGFDYTVNTNFIRVIASAPDRVENVVFILRTDSIAQENNETYTLELVHRGGTNIPTGDGVFFRNTVEVTIIDDDAVQIIFTEEDFRVNERNTTGPVSFMPVKVSKDSRIANPIVFDVIPLTVMNATNPPGLPSNVPSNNPFSPPFADASDFDTTVIRITFEPDEDEDDNVRDAPIAITDDNVNEAIEQVFVVHLILINSSNPISIDLTARSTSLCRIIDDDNIKIGFEVSSYIFYEPMSIKTIDSLFIPPNSSTSYGPVYLIKENGVKTEQIFGIVIQTSDAVPTGVNPATFGPFGDYETGGGGSFTTLFRPNQRRLNFEITLFPDDIPEEIEGFLASSARLDTAADETGITFPLPDYLSPTYASISIYIVDDHRAAIFPVRSVITLPNDSLRPSQLLLCYLSPKSLIPNQDYETQWITPGGSIVTGSGDGRYVLNNEATIPINDVPHPGTILTIQTLSYLDAGNYTCEARLINTTNADDWVSADVSLQLNMELTSTVTVTAGNSSIELSCEMSQFIRPDDFFIWETPSGQTIDSDSDKYRITFRNGAPESAANGSSVLVPSRVSTLIISNPVSSDSGAYTCRVNGTTKIAILNVTITDVVDTTTGKPGINTTMHPQDTPTILSTLIALVALVLTLIAAIALVALIACLYKKFSNRPQLNEQDVYYSTVGPQIDVYYSTVGPPLPPKSLRSLLATDSHIPHGEGTDHSMEETTMYYTEMDRSNPGAYHDTNNIANSMMIHSEVETEENAAHAYASGEQQDTIISNPAYATNVSIAPEIETERNEAYEQSQCVHS